ncbi:MAG: hypothetical protein QXS54_08180 [Candidatus Methanomethylicaceae archaeon]
MACDSGWMSTGKPWRRSYRRLCMLRAPNGDAALYEPHEHIVGRLG